MNLQFNSIAENIRNHTVVIDGKRFAFGYTNDPKKAKKKPYKKCKHGCTTILDTIYDFDQPVGIVPVCVECGIVLPMQRLVPAGEKKPFSLGKQYATFKHLDRILREMAQPF